MKKMPVSKRVGIVICTLDRRAVLQKCLDAVAAQRYPASLMSVWVHDDSSSDGTADMLSSRLGALRGAGFSGAEFFVSGEKKGIAYARNITAQKALPISDLILFLDDDVVMDENCLAEMAGYMAEAPSAGLVAPRMVRADDGRLLHGAYFVDPLTFSYRMSDSRVPLSCDWVDPACLLVKRKVISDIDGFWAGYFRSHEGVDFCLRAGKAGHEVIYLPSASARHIMRDEVLSPERIYYVYRNKFTLIRRNGSLLHRIFLIPLLAAAGLPKYILESLRRNNGLDPRDLALVFKAVIHGLIGREGAL